MNYHQKKFNNGVGLLPSIRKKSEMYESLHHAQKNYLSTRVRRNRSTIAAIKTGS